MVIISIGSLSSMTSYLLLLRMWILRVQPCTARRPLVAQVGIWSAALYHLQARQTLVLQKRGDSVMRLSRFQIQGENMPRHVSDLSLPLGTSTNLGIITSETTRSTPLRSQNTNTYVKNISNQQSPTWAALLAKKTSVCRRNP